MRPAPRSLCPSRSQALPGPSIHACRPAAVAEVLLFHHAQGQTAGFLAFADELRAAGHTVHTPDLYEGKTFASLDEGVKHAQEVGFGTISERGEAAAAGTGRAGLCGLLARRDTGAEARPDAAGGRGALFFSAALPASEFGGSWPQGVPLQIHMMEEDEWAIEDLQPYASSWRRSTGRSCSCTRATDICLRTKVSRTTTRVPRRCSGNGSSHSCRTSSRRRVDRVLVHDAPAHQGPGPAHRGARADARRVAADRPPRGRATTDPAAARSHLGDRAQRGSRRLEPSRLGVPACRPQAGSRAAPDAVRARCAGAADERRRPVSRWRGRPAGLREAAGLAP